MERACAALSTIVPRAGAEKVLVEDVRQALTNAGVEWQAEVPLSQGRVDLLAGSTAIELKVRETPAKVLAQLERYAEDPAITDLVLVTSSAKLRLMPARVGGKRLAVVYLPRL